jgi:hypothetical protein
VTTIRLPSTRIANADPFTVRMLIAFCFLLFVCWYPSKRSESGCQISVTV